jgi:regulator of CtrA degradation
VWANATLRWTANTRSGSMKSIRCVRRNAMADKSPILLEPVRFGERLASSQALSVLFREGMALVEETAAYLDGDGRNEAKVLSRHASLAYATESMRLTTRLMQLASWLLLHRAVNEGEMTLAQARKEKSKVKVGGISVREDESTALLPERLQTLIKRSVRVQERIQRLDATIHTPEIEFMPANPVEHQLGLLKAAFDRL